MRYIGDYVTLFRLRTESFSLCEYAWFGWFPVLSLTFNCCVLVAQNNVGPAAGDYVHRDKMHMASWHGAIVVVVLREYLVRRFGTVFGRLLSGLRRVSSVE